MKVVKYKVLDQLTEVVVFEGTKDECLEFIYNSDNGFLTLYP